MRWKSKLRFAKVNGGADMLDGAGIGYFFSSRGVRLISSEGIRVIPNFSKISSTWRKMNSWCADRLPSFFLLYALLIKSKENRSLLGRPVFKYGLV